MTNTNMDQEIQQARADILALGNMVKQAMQHSIQALKDNDLEASKTVFEKDFEINAKRYSIEASIIKVISSRQPVEKDLRILASVLEIGADLERMGDYAKGIATINLRSGGLGMPKTMNELHHMAYTAIDLLDRAMNAFINEDEEEARRIAREDDLVDALYQQIYYEMMDFVTEKPSGMARANHVLWAAHNLERMSDRVTNICERTIYVVTGEIGDLIRQGVPI